MLNGFRALDLTDETGFFCGKVLGEFGVDVIKIEKPGGDPARNKGPFYHDIHDPEKSLYWWGYNDSKRGITLDLETQKGRDAFIRLVRNADFVIESSPVGYMERLDLGYKQLSSINPRIIMISITPFGQTGPYKNYKATDIVAMAMGGIMSQNGESDGPPNRLNPDHAYCLAGSNAVLATLLAHYYRQATGEGQHIDVSIVECVMRENYREVPMIWEFMHLNVKRSGGCMNRGNFYSRCVWPCKDGHIVWTLFAGEVGIDENKALAKWLDEEGLLGQLKGFDWDTFSFDKTAQKDIDLIEEHIMKLTLKYSKKHLEDEAIKRGIRLSAVNNIEDLYTHPQLEHRDTWKHVKHDEIPDIITYPGKLVVSNKTDTIIRRRAPRIGEHNQEILGNELG